MNGCPRGFLYADAVYHPHRVTRPLIRDGERGTGSFREATWEEALDLVARRLDQVREEHGPAAVMRIGGSGACRGALHHTARIPQRFLAMFGGYTDTTGSFSSAATTFVKPFMYGTPLVGIDPKSLLETKMIILWGFNAADTRFGTETEAILAELRRNGVPMVVIDPRRTSTVKRYDARWIPIVPGTDSVLMLAMLHVILERKLENRPFIERYSTGFEELERHVLGLDGTPPKTPRWAAQLCGVAPETVEELAVLFAGARPGALLPGLSIQRTLGGENVDRLGGALQLALGNVGIAGGSVGAGQWNKIPGPRCGSLPVPDNPANSSLPVYRWADAVLEGVAGEWSGNIRALYNTGGNYLVQGASTDKCIRAFSVVDFVVTHDYFLTDTALHSDVVLPVTTFVEREDIISSSSNHLYFSHKAIDPVGQARDDWEIFAALADRLGFGPAFTEGKSPAQWLARFLEESEVDDVDRFRETGIYAGADQYQVGLSRFITDPEASPLATPSGRIEISCPALEQAGGTRIPTFAGSGGRDAAPELAPLPFHLVTPHDRMRNNSQFDNVSSFSNQVDRSVWIHPADAHDRDIRSGDAVILVSESGTARSTARVTEDIRRGVLSWNSGGWMTAGATPPGTEPLDTANKLTSTEPTMPSHGSRTHSNRVDIRRAR
jgi:molybdopterin guanine dinucleotide-containing S/N-oxide reductase-like protein